MRKFKEKKWAILRVAFGVVWAIDALLKWQGAFFNGFTSYFTSMVQGQPGWVQAWINFWVAIIGAHPHSFAILIACAESALALGLILGVFLPIVYGSGIVLSLLIWSTVEGFGGPYIAGVTDIGAALIYVFVFVALWLAVDSSAYSLDALWRRHSATSSAAAPSSQKISTTLKEQNHQTSISGVSSSSSSLLIKTLVAVIILLLALLVISYLPPQLQTSTPTSMNLAGLGAMPGGMTLKTYNLNPKDPIPTVDFDIEKDPNSGWNVHILTTNFTFTPQNVNQAPVANQGHAHLYIDGTLFVLYGPWYHFNDLTPGQHTIVVTLNANDHSVFAINGVYIKKEKTITQP